MICPNCSAELTGNGAFCTECGQRLEEQKILRSGSGVRIALGIALTVLGLASYF